MTNKSQVIPDAIQKRHDDMQEWLNENHRAVFNDQKHLDEGTPERAYWHYGYMVALRDILKLMEDGQCQTRQ
jgi:hypothetical protein